MQKRETHTIRATESDDYMAKLRSLWLEEYEWVCVSQAMPVMMSGALFYTVTISGGQLV